MRPCRWRFIIRWSKIRVDAIARYIERRSSGERPSGSFGAFAADSSSWSISGMGTGSVPATKGGPGATGHGVGTPSPRGSGRRIRPNSLRSNDRRRGWDGRLRYANGESNDFGYEVAV